LPPFPPAPGKWRTAAPGVASGLPPLLAPEHKSHAVQYPNWNTVRVRWVRHIARTEEETSGTWLRR
jgi:hypothetical protein